jgi:hypothetical protein
VAIRKILVSLRARSDDAGPRRYELAMTIERGASPLRITFSGLCTFGERANYLSGGKLLFPAASDHAGFRCELPTGQGSQSAGILLLLGGNLRSATLYLPVHLVGRAENAARSIELAASDQVLQFENVYRENCASLSPLPAR